MPLKFNYSDFDDLSSRARNIFHRIGTKNDVIDYFKKHGSFLLIPGTGLKTNIELCSLCEFYIQEEIPENEQINQALSEIVPKNILEYIDLYNLKKSTLSRRLKNILDVLESNCNFKSSQNCQIEFMMKYILSGFDLKIIDKCGLKTAQEFKVFASLFKKEEFIQPTDLTEKIGGDIVSEIYRRLSYKFSKNEIIRYVDTENGIYHFFDLFAYYVLHSKIKTIQREVLLNLYFSECSKSQNDLAKQLGCTKERIRQVELQITKKWLPNSLSSFQECLTDIPSNLHGFNARILSVPGGHEFEYRNCDQIKYNTGFEYITTRLFLDEKYYSVTDIIISSKEKFTSLEMGRINYFIEKEFAESIEFIKLLRWADQEIFQFSVIEFDYNLSVLIKRFFIEHNISIVTADFEGLDGLFQNYIRTDWTMFNVIRKKNLRNQSKVQLVDKIENILLDAAKPLKTREILLELNKDEPDIGKLKLLKVLNKSTNRFSRLGSGMWGLINNEFHVHGSLRDIVTRKLNEVDIPLHISEILNYICTFRPISEHSLLSNLRNIDDGVFIFLNSSFIGLKTKTYDEHWYNLPKIKANIIRAAIRNFSTIEKRINFLTYKHNIPLIHADFLMRKHSK
jgi:hypothetical protein